MSGVKQVVIFIGTDDILFAVGEKPRPNKNALPGFIPNLEVTEIVIYDALYQVVVTFKDPVVKSNNTDGSNVDQVFHNMGWCLKPKYY